MNLETPSSQQPSSDDSLFQISNSRDARDLFEKTGLPRSIIFYALGRSNTERTALNLLCEARRAIQEAGVSAYTDQGMATMELAIDDLLEADEDPKHVRTGEKISAEKVRAHDAKAEAKSRFRSLLSTGFTPRSYSDEVSTANIFGDKIWREENLE